MDYLQFLEVLWVPATIMFGWQQRTISKLTDKLDEKADVIAVTELKSDIKEVIKLLTENRIEMGRWQGLIEHKQLKS